LRRAIDSANTNVGIDTISFEIAGSIPLASELPALTDDSTYLLGSLSRDSIHSVTLDGTAKTVGSGFTVQSSNNLIKGLRIDGFSDNGIEVVGAVSGNTFSKNLIYNSGGLEIDLGVDGVTANDAGDGDTGPNNLVNFPEIDSIFANGASTFTVFAMLQIRAM